MKTKTKRLLSASSFFSNMVFFAPVAILVRTRCGITVSEFFILQAILSFAVFLLEVPCGIITDKIGFKKSILISQSLVCITRVIFLIGGNFFVFAIEAIVEAFSVCFISGTQESYHYVVFGEKDYLRTSATIQNFGQASFILTTLLFPVLNTFFGISGLILLTVISSAVSFIVSLFLPDEKYFKRQSNEDEQNMKKISFKEFLSRVISKDFVLVILITSILSVGGLIVSFLFILKLHEVGFSDYWISIIILLGESVLLTTPFIINKTENLSKGLLLFIELTFIAVLFFLIAILKSYILFIPMILLPCSLSLPSYVTLDFTNALIDTNNLKEQRATVLSICNELSNLVEITFLFIASVLESLQGNSIGVVFFGCGIVYILVAVFSKIFSKNM